MPRFYRSAGDSSGFFNSLLDAGPAPLPFIESRYSPEAFPRELVPTDLKGEVDLTFLHAHLTALPIPLVRLPRTCVDSPWQLVFLAHELGHHVQYRLLPGQQLVDDAENVIGKAVAKVSTLSEEQWRMWSREIFADFYSVLMMGPWAAWAMLQLEVRNRSLMMTPRTAYPSPFIRIVLMLETVRILGLSVEKEWPETLIGLAEATPTLETERTAATRVAEGLLGLTAYDQTVRSLSGHALHQFETDVPSWSRALQGEVEVQAMETLEAARLAIAGTVAAWSALSMESEERQRARKREALRARAVDLVARCREPGKRGVAAQVTDAGLGRSLATALLAQDLSVLDMPAAGV